MILRRLLIDTPYVMVRDVLCICFVVWCCGVLRCVAVCCSVLVRDMLRHLVWDLYVGVFGVLQCVAVCCRVLHCAGAVCYT